ncbi:MAG: hypothetical protein PHU06_00065 [Gallionella sp.]|nr:hypothetical protein [Gallionella sp.]MDD4958628.1 hypothetical protein [Gallionella sp.]
MMSGFVQVDCHIFYTVYWPQIKSDVEAMESNWEDAKKGVRPIVIKWGYKDENSEEKIILAISKSDGTGDEHWVVESLIAKT